MSQGSSPLIEFRGISKIYGEHIALDQIDLTIHHDEFFAILGGSGSGKSTLLRLLAGFETPSTGDILIDGHPINNIPPYQRPINMMFQSYALFPHMTVKQNIAFGLKQDKLPRNTIQSRCDEVLNLVELEKFANRKPHQLSGGQRQRVALARALAKRPKILLLDEPLSALDKKLREKMQFDLVDIHEHTGISFMMVTHDQAEAMTMSDRIAVMNDGIIQQVGTPTEIYEFPQNRYTADFIGQVNTFECQVKQATPEGITLTATDTNTHFFVDRQLDVTEGQTLWCAIRPEKITVTKTNTPAPHNKPNQITGTVNDIAYLGGISTYHVKLTNGTIIKATDFNIERQADHPTWEDTVTLTWDSANIMVLFS